MAKRLLVKVNEADNVAIAVKEIKAGTQVSEDLVYPSGYSTGS